MQINSKIMDKYPVFISGQKIKTCKKDKIYQRHFISPPIYLTSSISYFYPSTRSWSSLYLFSNVASTVNGTMMLSNPLRQPAENLKKKPPFCQDKSPLTIKGRFAVGSSVIHSHHDVAKCYLSTSCSSSRYQAKTLKKGTLKNLQTSVKAIVITSQLRVRGRKTFQ